MLARPVRKAVHPDVAGIYQDRLASRQIHGGVVNGCVQDRRGRRSLLLDRLSARYAVAIEFAVTTLLQKQGNNIQGAGECYYYEHDHRQNFLANVSFPKARK